MGSGEEDLSALECNCPVCDREWGEGRVWRCGHTVCPDCHHGLSQGDGDTAPCPICSVPSQKANLARAPPNHALAGALLTIRALQTALALARLNQDPAPAPPLHLQDEGEDEGHEADDDDTELQAALAATFPSSSTLPSTTLSALSTLSDTDDTSDYTLLSNDLTPSPTSTETESSLFS